jgi:protocatechuate 3,4-dioxygenase beta subunit
MLKPTLLPLLLLLASVTGSHAHPGESEAHHHAEARAIAATHSLMKRSGSAYSACANSSRKRALNDVLAERRAREIESLRAGVVAKKAQLARRQSDAMASGAAPSGAAPSGSMGAMPSGSMGAMPSGSMGASGGGGGSATFDSYGESLLNTSHASSRTDITANATSSTLFPTSADNTTCLLQPEVTIGPYWVAGEYVRADMSETQPGLPIYMSTQVIDVATCEPVTGLYWEMWHANASGVYSGVVASGNGDSTDLSNLNTTFLRGIQPTDDLGVATIQSVFPGHYTGRATHVHVVGHANATVYANGTIGTGSAGDGDSIALHIGQLFFDTALLDAVAQISPYAENTQTVTENSEDSILAQSAVQGASDPFFQYVYLGEDVSDGVYAWVTVGINTNETRTTNAAAYIDADGGHVGTDSLDVASGGSAAPVADAASAASTVTSSSTTSTSGSTTSVTSSTATTSASANSASSNTPTFLRTSRTIAKQISRAISALFA